MNAISTLLHSFAVDLHTNFYDQIYRYRYSLSPFVFQWMRRRIANVRALYFHHAFCHEENHAPIWEIMMVDSLVFHRQDPIGFFESDVMYREALVQALLNLRPLFTPAYSDSDCSIGTDADGSADPDADGSADTDAGASGAPTTE
ncbi:MAG: hypothetical protein GY696_02100 [Gammaproteobacteria bacterium]|nr:hypothetical protein [Gammaproteobacteria bacterium]